VLAVTTGCGIRTFPAPPAARADTSPIALPSGNKRRAAVVSRRPAELPAERLRRIPEARRGRECSEGFDAGLQRDDRQRGRRAAMAASCLRRSPSALQPRLSGRGEHPRVARPGTGRRLRGSMAKVHGREPAAVRTAARVITPAKAPVIVSSSINQSRSTRSTGSSAISPPRKDGRSRPGRPPGSGCSWSAPALRACRARITCGGSGTTLRSVTPTPSQAE